MAILTIPDEGKQFTSPSTIKKYLTDRGIYFNQWPCTVQFESTATQEEILAAYEQELSPFMNAGGYKVADVISINELTENYPAIRSKFLSEHTHSEDEIRFFVDGKGLFWFNLPGEPVFNVLCERGDLISVPAGTKHWFDAGENNPFVKAIRIFIDQNGWTPEYTDSKIESKYAEVPVPKRTIEHIVTDIEGTTTSVAFVYDVLFPYFRERISDLTEMTDQPIVKEAFEQVIALTEELEDVVLATNNEVIGQLIKWSVEDRKITPLKTLQGVLWEEGYTSGQIKGHVYNEVPEFFKKWKTENKTISIFSSGSVAAQKLIFGYSEQGDLTSFISDYFDTTTGMKRDTVTYSKIAQQLNAKPEHILFLSDIVEELIAAEEAGYQTIQLVREGTQANWPRTAVDFNEVDRIINI